MNDMQSIIHRQVNKLEDTLRYSAEVRMLAGYGKLAALRLLRSNSTSTSALVARTLSLCSAIRNVGPSRLGAGVHEQVNALVRELDPSRVDWSSLVPKVEDTRMPKAIVLKPYVSQTERGVIFSAFETNTARLFRHLDATALRDLSNRYDLIVAPTASPYTLLGYLVPYAWNRPVYSLISHPEEFEDIPKMSPNYRTIRLFASSWVNPRNFTPLPLNERDIDIIMVASFGKVKRHHVLFAALRRMPRTLRVTLVGQDQDGRTAADILKLARAYGVEEQLTIVSNADYPEVAHHLVRAKVSLLFSVNEGSSVIVTESLFANTPMGLLRRAHIGSRVFINDRTGVLLDESELDTQLLSFLERAPRMSPRAWAENGLIDCDGSTAYLNQVLRDYALRDGNSWTTDIIHCCWAPNVQPLHPEDAIRIKSEQHEILDRYGVTVGIL
jgi:glycosyltransferase involved in cell wall biosynthesis